MRTRASSPAKYRLARCAPGGQAGRREAALLRQIAELEEFAQRAAHDLAEPLRTVAGCLQFAIQRAGAAIDPEALELLSLAAGGAARAQDLVEGALSVARRPGADTRHLTNSAEAVSAAIGNLRQAIDQSQAILRLGNLPPVLADPVLLARLIQNLLSNAIRHGGGSPPEISVECEERARDWLFRVEDRGPGFIRQPVPGLGLQICARIAARHGGRLWGAAAERGAAWCFTLSKS